MPSSPIDDDETKCASCGVRYGDHRARDSTCPVPGQSWGWTEGQKFDTPGLTAKPDLAAQLAEAKDYVALANKNYDRAKAQLAEAVGLLRELHANMNHQTGPGCCPSGRFLARVDGAK